ncbi:FAD-linked oxidoreductase [Fontimonas thermophila]|uniref:FAD-linked oxidoreductase n=1 Tax=Fontimonas thermophila TaxID=1076937 RepID=A0A1I2HA10_9GAMM|nr:D-arabinono-1,4-lactone oxidase [Fontimonas thermophila]SFF25576.1 FAD-linked oxidoreductase [Fontimonas thermophila]
MKRRTFLIASLGTLAAASGLGSCKDREATHLPQPPAPTVGPDGKRRLPWQNWSGYQFGLPAVRAAPASEDELAALLPRTAAPVRPVGAGHSFAPLVPTDGTLLSLRNFDGLRAHDAHALTATVGAGTRLGALGALLDGIGQALPNMPDIDEQSLAGAIATGTHGTGQALGALHAYVTALRLVTPQGEVLDCSRMQHPEVFAAARVSLGSLGVITQVTLQNVPTHHLKRRVWAEPLDSLLERFDELARAHHSFELYVIPFCSRGIAITIDPTEEPPRPRGQERDNDALVHLQRLRDLTGWWPGLRRRLLDLATAGLPEEEAVDLWYRIFPSSREVRFNEMEYHLPRDALLPALKQVLARVESRHREEFFPIEVRTVRGDDAWLSPFYGHAVSGSIAVHRHHREDPLPYFADIEPIYQAYEGRPHWGKMHTLDARTLAQRYPRWRDFLALREMLDPHGRMLNPYLRRMFGLD